MNTVIIVLMILGYLFGAVVLLGSSVLGFVNTKPSVSLLVNLALFVLLPCALLWAKIILPLVALTIVGYGIVAAGVKARTLLIQFRSRLLEEIKKNLDEKEE